MFSDLESPTLKRSDLMVYVGIHSGMSVGAMENQLNRGQFAGSEESPGSGRYRRWSPLQMIVGITQANLGQGGVSVDDAGKIAKDAIQAFAKDRTAVTWAAARVLKAREAGTSWRLKPEDSVFLVVTPAGRGGRLAWRLEIGAAALDWDRHRALLVNLTKLCQDFLLDLHEQENLKRVAGPDQ